MRPVTLPSWARSPLTADAGLALGFAVAAGLISPASGLAFAVSLPLMVATAVRRLFPVWSAFGVYFLALMLLLTGNLSLTAIVFVLFALYSVSVHGPVWANQLAYLTTWAGLALAAIGATMVPPEAGGSWLWPILTYLAVATALWALGLVRRARAQRLAALADRAHRLALEHDQHLHLATANERIRIAREMHDVVAQSIQQIVAQSDQAPAVDGRPPESGQALQGVWHSGQNALADMHRILGVLRTATPDPPQLASQPDRPDLGALVRWARARGQRVELTESGQPGELPPGLAMAISRICQQALVNVVKHAGPRCRTRIELTWSATSLELSIVNDAPRLMVAAKPAGHLSADGLIGIRERADMYGGTVVAGPTPNDGFAVRVHLPLEPVARHSSGG